MTTDPFLDRILSEKKAFLTPKLTILLKEFFTSYSTATQWIPEAEKNKMFAQLIELITDHLKSPSSFEIFHQAIRQPFDYYQFGLDFIRPLINFCKSQIFGMEYLRSIQKQLKNHENVILFANHQTEPDPQIISLLLEKVDAHLASDMIFVAGHRVTTDPLAVPLSLGRNLLCIYSKKHINYPPEDKEKKILHNQRTMNKMCELLNEGGKCIYVAPSGGRDRRNSIGELDIAPFDSHSIELFWLISQKGNQPTHFYPLALHTHDLMPPPKQVEKDIGEKRYVHVMPVFLGFGPEIEMNKFEHLDKKIKRGSRSEHIWNSVRSIYQSFPKHL